MELLQERFWAKVNKTDTCWLWNARVDRGGYGQFAYSQGLYVRAHRFAYELFYGSIPKGLEIDHLCDVRNCINPEHLEAVTPKVNSIRRSMCDHSLYQSTHCVHGHPRNEANTYVSNGNSACRLCNKAAAQRYAQRKKVVK